MAEATLDPKAQAAQAIWDFVRYCKKPLPNPATPGVHLPRLSPDSIPALQVTETRVIPDLLPHKEYRTELGRLAAKIERGDLRTVAMADARGIGSLVDELERVIKGHHDSCGKVERIRSSAVRLNTEQLAAVQTETRVAAGLAREYRHLAQTLGTRYDHRSQWAVNALDWAAEKKEAPTVFFSWIFRFRIAYPTGFRLLIAGGILFAGGVAAYAIASLLSKPSPSGPQGLEIPPPQFFIG